MWSYYVYDETNVTHLIGEKIRWKVENFLAAINIFPQQLILPDQN